MRTTVTLDDDLAALLEKKRARDGQSFKDALNETLRMGLAAVEERPAQTEKFEIKPLSLGRARLANMDNIAEVLEFAEGPDYK